MISLYASDEVGRIVGGLAALPGSTAVDVVAKRYPRLGIVGEMTCYQENTLHVPIDMVGEALDKVLQACTDAEDIAISVQGVLESDAVRAQLKHVAQDAHHEFGLDARWDIRLSIEGRLQEARGTAYVMTLFTAWTPSARAGSD